jgi:hypothetical protein
MGRVGVVDRLGELQGLGLELAVVPVEVELGIDVRSALRDGGPDRPRALCHGASAVAQAVGVEAGVAGDGEGASCQMPSSISALRWLRRTR